VKGKHEHWPCIVLVDDEELVLSTLGMLLELNGDFRVMSFTDPIRAIEELERTPGRCQLGLHDARHERIGSSQEGQIAPA
jgi:DNA-binding NarL/FixJ family response regulator